ncbi:WxcM-like domain-containing protein [Parapedobacter indicus]|uniref:dTDP-4-dehydrorhamnose 3,5-epimerase n=1 Tax=Parapedobacter indicus TaxID=1477437 RepID=A0A1I3TCP5_9SPHI|nr:WxcM-like domain-containing protein [Parapedobacter indicus]PPK99531.1 dTDP-4-dehydrorhamnose 3,5-epimerase [Parapedobacter indicus]SFJ68958.1 dTDP-4-dehydrorhamnose 3,5-epimerase [Parapedobacter indicus]
MEEIVITQGGVASDHRGSIRFVNDFDMTAVKRFYIIENKDTETIRGWRAHRIEQRWFYVLEGAFFMKTVKIDDWSQASKELPVEHTILRSEEQRIIHVPVGFGTAFQALEPGSRLLVFADHGIEHAQHDDYTYPVDYFIRTHTPIGSKV